MRRLFLAAALLATPFAGAQLLDDYQARISVDSQSPGARDKALREALAQVLARVSGDANVSAGGRTAPILARATTLVSSVGYETSDKNELQLVAIFDPQAVETALKQQGLPVHGILAGNVEDVTLTVSGVDSAHAYARVLNHLRSQPSVKNVGVAEAREHTLLFQLRVEGGAERLAGALSVGGVLKRDVGAPGPMAFVLKQ